MTAPPPGGAVTFPCAKCGDPAACFVAPPWLRALVPTATHIAVADATAAPSAVASQPRHDESRPVLMPCPGCGASLKLTSDTTRTLQCAFCKNDVYLPDDLWRRLHPMRTMAPWFVRFEGASRAELARAAKERWDLNERSIADAAAAKASAERDADVARQMIQAYLALAVSVLLLLGGIGALLSVPPGLAKSDRSSVGLQASQNS